MNLKQTLGETTARIDRTKRYRSVIANYANIDLLAEMTDEDDPLAHSATGDALRQRQRSLREKLGG